MKSKLWMALGVFVALVVALTLPSPASAASATWTGNGESSVTGEYEATLKGSNTSVETANLGVTIPEAGATVTFNVDLHDGAVCTAGAPRVFLTVAGVTINSWDQLLPDGHQCGDEGKVTFTVPEGAVTAAGLVYDNGVAGKVVISNLTIGGTKVAFKEPEVDESESPSPSPSASESESPSPSPSASESESPSPSPSASESESPSPTVSPSESVSPTSSATTTPSESSEVIIPVGNNDDQSGGLPVTGAKIGLYTGLGAVLFGAGVGLLLLVRRRREEDEQAELI